MWLKKFYYIGPKFGLLKAFGYCGQIKINLSDGKQSGNCALYRTAHELAKKLYFRPVHTFSENNCKEFIRRILSVKSIKYDYFTLNA